MLSRTQFVELAFCKIVYTHPLKDIIHYCHILPCGSPVAVRMPSQKNRINDGHREGIGGCIRYITYGLGHLLHLHIHGVPVIDHDSTFGGSQYPVYAVYQCGFTYTVWT